MTAPTVDELTLRNENLHLQNDALHERVADLEHRLYLANETTRDLAAQLRATRGSVPVSA